jgi:hypothetical protein
VRGTGTVRASDSKCSASIAADVARFDVVQQLLQSDIGLLLVEEVHLDTDHSLVTSPWERSFMSSMRAISVSTTPSPINAGSSRAKGRPVHNHSLAAPSA